MKALFKDLYRQYLEKGVSPTDFGQFKEELNHIPDEELWNVMIDMEKDATTEIGMPPMMIVCYSPLRPCHANSYNSLLLKYH